MAVINYFFDKWDKQTFILINISYFEVERFFDKSTDYETVGLICTLDSHVLFKFQFITR